MIVPPICYLYWKRAWRVIPTLYPDEEIYAPLAARGDWPALIQLERLTNSGVRQEWGDRRFIRPGDILPKGKSAYNIGRPFAHPRASRFSDGSFGVFYAAKSLGTAVAESAFHTTRFYLYTSEPPGIKRERVLVAHVRGPMHDIRKRQKNWTAVYRLNDYSESQKLGASLWKNDALGIAYRSVRDPEGECVAVFRPQAITHCRQERCLQFEWDGTKISAIYEIREFLR